MPVDINAPAIIAGNETPSAAEIQAMTVNNTKSAGIILRPEPAKQTTLMAVQTDRIMTDAEILALYVNIVEGISDLNPSAQIVYGENRPAIEGYTNELVLQIKQRAIKNPEPPPEPDPE